jgi:hypothetical protein
LGQPKNCRQGERGSSLLALCILVIILGLGSVYIADIFELWGDYRKENVTEERKQEIRLAIENFVQRNGRYPCPASLSVPVDAAGFGTEISNDCSTAGAVAGTAQAPGRGGRIVRTGALPVRNLNLPDEYMVDGHQTRFVYTVTEVYASPGAPVDLDDGAITIRDSQGFNATAQVGNIIYAVISQGNDGNGSYNINGIQAQACDTTMLSGANCNYDVDATFVNTTLQSTNQNTRFTQSISYNPPLSSTACTDSSGGPSPFGDIAFLVDTSGSMAEEVTGAECPAGLGNRCSRMDVARWAMRRIVPSHIQRKYTYDDPGATDLTGFVKFKGNPDVAIPQELQTEDITFDDAAVTGGPPADPAAQMQDLEDELQGMCPQGYTPLGPHMVGLADRLTDGLQDKPNKIIMISDGRHNQGKTNAYDAAQYVIQNYPNIQIDVIDVIGDNSMASIAEDTGGEFFTVSSPQQLLDALSIATGTCNPNPPNPVTDVDGCGSIPN